MPSNERPAFDVLTADGNTLYLHAIRDARPWQESLTELRDAVVAALRESQAPEAEPSTYEQPSVARRAAQCANDQHLACAQVEGITENVARERERIVNEKGWMAYRTVEPVDATMPEARDREYPAPKPAECRLSDGRVVEWSEWETPQPHRTIDIVTKKGRAGCSSRRRFKSLEDMRAFPLPYADWQLIDKAFAATRTEDTTDGR